MKFTKLLMILSFSLVSSLVFAGGYQTGKIVNIRARASDNLHYFTLSGTHNDKPTCNGKAALDYWMIKDENSAAGKTQISMLLTAYASGKSISVTGTGQCTRWADGEDVDEMWFAN